MDMGDMDIRPDLPDDELLQAWHCLSPVTDALHSPWGFAMPVAIGHRHVEPAHVLLDNPFTTFQSKTSAIRG